MKNLPKSIWLNFGDECPDDVDFRELSEVTWSENKVFNNDIQFVREDAVWRNPDAELPDFDVSVLLTIRITRTYMNYTHDIVRTGWRTPDSSEDQDEYNFAGLHHTHRGKVIAWMPIPELPKSCKQ